MYVISLRESKSFCLCHNRSSQQYASRRPRSLLFFTLGWYIERQTWRYENWGSPQAPVLGRYYAVSYDWSLPIRVNYGDTSPGTIFEVLLECDTDLVWHAWDSFPWFWISRIEWMGQIFHTTHIRGAARVIRNIVENHQKSYPLGMLNAWLESVNQVFRNPHTGFLKLGDVSFHVSRSDSPHDVCARHDPWHLKYTQILWIIPKSYEFHMDYTYI